MRYIIYGAGAVGGTIGGRLYGAGRDTVLICRGAHLAAIRECGLTLRDHTGEQTLPVPAEGHPRALQFRSDDVLILTTKTQDTDAALVDLEAAGGGELPIVCCQNGVENERIAARRFHRVYAMLAYVAAVFLEPGLIRPWSAPEPGVLDVGLYPSGVDALTERIAGDLTAAGFICRPDPAVMRLKYTKLLGNLANAVQALVSPMGQEARGLMDRTREEAIRVYEAAGIEYLPPERYEEMVLRHVQQLPPESTIPRVTSTWQSLTKGSERLETDFLNGEIVLLGRQHGVATPYNDALRRLAQQHAREHRKPGALSVAEVEAVARSKEAADAA